MTGYPEHLWSIKVEFDYGALGNYRAWSDAEAFVEGLARMAEEQDNEAIQVAIFDCKKRVEEQLRRQHDLLESLKVPGGQYKKSEPFRARWYGEAAQILRSLPEDSEHHRTAKTLIPFLERRRELASWGLEED